MDAGAPDAISFVVVNWNSKDDLAECLASLEAQTDRDFETIVVDNGSTDGSLELLRERFPWVHLVATGENLGFAEGCNRGIAVAKGAWIFTLNNDAVAARDLVASLKKAAREADRDVGMIQAKIVFKQKPDRTNSTGLLLFRDGRCMDRDFDAPVREKDAISEVFCPSAGAALYRREMLDRVKLPTGWFDRSFFMYFEDVDLGWRCRIAGYRALYLPDAIVHHAFHGSSERHGSTWVDRQCRTNRMRVLFKNASKRFLVVSAAQTARDVVYMVRHDGFRDVPKVLAAIGSALAQRSEVTRLERAERRGIERAWAIEKPR